MFGSFVRKNWHSLLLSLGLVGLTLPASAAPVVKNNSFEAHKYNVTSDGTALNWPFYTNAIADWTCTGGTGTDPTSPAGDGPFLSGAIAADGNQAAFCQNKGSFSQDVDGFEAGKKYYITFYALGRAGDTKQQRLSVTLDGAEIVPAYAPKVAVAGQAMEFKAVQFDSPGAGTHTLTFNVLDDDVGQSVNLDFINIFEVGSAGKIAAPATRPFGLSSVKVNTDKTITINNTGGSAISVTSLALSGTDAAEFSVVSPAGAFTIPAVSSQDVVVRFTAAKTGAASATLTINSNDATNPALAVALSGTGVLAAVANWNPYPCYKATTAPAIDGTVSPSEWQGEPIVMTKEMMQMFGGSDINSYANIPNDATCSGTFYLMWDSNYLYMAAQVKDPAITYNCAQGTALNGTDGVQLCLDYNNTGAALNADDSVTIHDVTPGTSDNTAKAGYWQHWSKTLGNEAGYPATFPNSKFASRLVTGGYEVELAIKWSDCSAFSGAAIGKTMGYMTMIMAFDSTTLNDLWWNAGNGANVIGDASGWNKLVLCDVLNPAQNWANYTANKAATAPVVDGVIKPAEYRTSEIIMTKANEQSMGGGMLNHGDNTVNDADLSGRFWMTWDSTYLYMAARVYDNQVCNTLNQGGGLNGTDVVQLCLDHNNTGAAANADDSVSIHDVTPGQLADPTKAAYWQHWSKTLGNECGYPASFPNSKWAGRTLADGYEVELAIKWSDCAGFSGATVGKVMNYMMLLMDLDSPDGVAAPALRDLWWNGGKGDQTGASIGDASQWNKLTLADVQTGVAPTPTPTATPTPTPTPTPPPQVWNPYTAAMATHTPTIDGTINAVEYNTPEIDMNLANMAALGGSDINSYANTPTDADCSGKFWMTWDTTYLYMAARIMDPAITYNCAQGTALNGTDGVQLCLDYNNTGAAMLADDSVTIHDVTPGTSGDPTKAGYWQHWSKTLGNEVGYPASFPNSKFASRLITGGYEVELAIKWSDCTGFSGAVLNKTMGYMTMIMAFNGTTLADLWWNAGSGANIIGDASGWNKLKLGPALALPVNAAHTDWTTYQ